jgi:virginiamycin B lyase
MDIKSKLIFYSILVVGAMTVHAADPVIREYPVPKGSHPHDVAPAIDGGVWYTAQHTGELGYLDPKTGKTRHILLGKDSAPHGVIVGPDGAPWITDSGQNAIVRVDPRTDQVNIYPLSSQRNVNLNTATFDKSGTLWFTGQNGYYGRVDPKTGKVQVFEAPGGRGPYGICTAPDGSVWYASLAGSHIARINTKTGEATAIEPPTPDQGARRVWADSKSRIWVSEWNSGQVSVYDPKTNQWQQWKLPGDHPQAYAVYVDNHDTVWLSDFGANAIVSFDPTPKRFKVFTLPSPGAQVRQILGRPGEVWLPESGADKITRICEAC